ncbi:MAG: type IV pilus assembly protein PilM [Kiritimatiellae bacterium]|nr:type IV pilus assembly protein PilM [Kiritimatiellia bacterium]
MERILTLNIGATRLALAEFEVRSGRGPGLLRYTFGDLPEGSAENPDTFSVEIEQALRGMMATSGIRAGRIHVALSGQMAFPRFIKVLSDSPEKMDEQIRFEQEQAAPFPLSEAIFSHTLIGLPDAGEQHVMIVASREALVSAVTRALLNLGCEPEVVDVAPIALYNAVRFNYPEMDGCTLVVDIGARCTNLVFVEQDRIFYRSIPVAGNTITAEIAKTFGISAEDAEAFKCERGLVAQGGAFAVDDPDVDRLSKVIRNVMTRLNAEIARSISFYRSQQSGSAPSQMLLTGASAQLPYMQNFFEEKLQIAVDFLNPFQAVSYPKHVDAEQFGHDAFSMPVLVGLALRRGLTCPVEINLVSQDIVERKVFRRRLPFLALAAIGMVATLGTWWLFVNNLKNSYETQQATIADRISAYQNEKDRYDRVDKKAKAAEARATAYRNLMKRRGQWMGMLVAVDKAVPDGLWITNLKARRQENILQGVDISVSVWKDLEPTLVEKGKTIAETIAGRLAAQDVFADDQKEIQISKINQSVDWLTSFDLTAKLKDVEAPKTTTTRRSRR